MEIRLQKILSQWGIASRRQAEQMIGTGEVRVNGELAHVGQKVSPERDRIEVKGQVVQPGHKPQPVYLLLHKPTGVLSTCQDPWQRPTVLDLLAPRYHHQGVHPVGRLDEETTGALLLTNDGQLTYGLTHPRHHISKVYQVWLQGNPPQSVLQQWCQGVMLDDRLTLPAQVRKILNPRQDLPGTCLEVILREGRNRQIRRVAAQLGYPVILLHRTKIGPIGLSSPQGSELPLGQYRPLRSAEINGLQRMIRSTSPAHPKSSRPKSSRPNKESYV